MKYTIATHEYLADDYVSSIQVLTKKNDIYAVNVYVGDKDAALQLKTITKSFENQEEVIIFIDLMRGSMMQVVVPYLDRYNVHCITGINLPLILEFVPATGTIDGAYIEHTIQEAQKQMVFVGHLLKQTQQSEGLIRAV